MDRISEVNRESVKLAQVPKAVQQAHLAAEDRNFYENSGISPTGIARAVWVGLRGGATQGGSTITQQYVKNYFLTQDQTLSRKGREIIISIKIAKQQSKDTILENYLNTIYYGRGAYGIQTASKAYFNKDVSKLNASEGALLASVIRGPSFYDPGLGAEQKANAEERVELRHGRHGHRGLADAAAAGHPEVPDPAEGRRTAAARAGPTGYLVDLVKKELKSNLKLTDADIDKGGYKVVTTIDKQAQDAAAKAVKARMPTGKDAADLHVGLTSIKPGDGAIVALYGGADYAKEQFNTATDATHAGRLDLQGVHAAGGAAQDEPISTKTRLQRREPAVLQGVRGLRRRRERQARAGDQLRVPELRADRPAHRDRATRSTPSTPSSTSTWAPRTPRPPRSPRACRKRASAPTTPTCSAPTRVTVRDMANAYATIAANGVRATPYLIKTVKGGPGDLDYKVKVTKKAALRQGRHGRHHRRDDAGRPARQRLVRPGASAGRRRARRERRPTTRRPGSTASPRSWRPPSASTRADGDEVDDRHRPATRRSPVATIPVRIWTDYMEAALKGQKVLQFPERDGLGDDDVYTPPPHARRARPRHHDDHDHTAHHHDDHADPDPHQRHRQADADRDDHHRSRSPAGTAARHRRPPSD